MERTVIHRHATRAVSVGHNLLTGASDCARALANFRVKPGNVGKRTTRAPQFVVMIEQAIALGKPVGIDVNRGSLGQALLADMMDANAHRSVPQVAEAVMRETQVTSALSSAAHLTPERKTVAIKSVA